jgi:hypothetical protein
MDRSNVHFFKAVRSAVKVFVPMNIAMHYLSLVKTRNLKEGNP